VEGVDIWTVPIRTSAPTAVVSVVAETFLNSVLSLISAYDVAHVFTLAIPSSSLSAFWLKLMKKTRKNPQLVLGDWDDWWGRGGILSDYGRLPSMVGTLLEEKIGVAMDGLTVVSESLAIRAMNAGAEKSRIFRVPNGADVEFISPLDKDQCRKKLGIPDDELLFSHVGFTDPRAFHTLVTSFQVLLSTGIRSTLALAGDLGQENLRTLRMSNSEKILDFGSVPYHKVIDLLGASDILLLSMRESIIEEARWPIRLGDYLASGRPIIATDIGEVGRIVKAWNCGLTFRAYDYRALASDMHQLALDPDLMRMMGSKSREAAMSLSWSRIAKNLEQVYERLS